MSYKIAVASTDGINVDRSFGDAEEFQIIDVDDSGKHVVGEIRRFEGEEKLPAEEQNCSSSKGCGSGNGCGGSAPLKFLLIEDCRCLICTHMGFKIHKQLEKKAIGAFEVDCRVEDALKKIISYYDRVDRHQSLRGIAKGQNI